MSVAPRISIAAALVAASTAACSGPSRQSLQAARSSAYDAEFDVVYGRVVEAVRASYQQVQLLPEQHAIKTAWHKMPLTDAANPDFAESIPHHEQSASASADDQEQANAALNDRRTRQSYVGQETQYFIRFDVMILGGPPWRVQINGFASRWDGTGPPTPLDGAETPYWLEKRKEKLEVAIYERLRRYAVPLEAPAPAAR